MRPGDGARGDKDEGRQMFQSMTDRRALLREVFPADAGEDTLPLWINGAWVAASPGQVFDSVDPALGETLVSVGSATRENLEDAVAAAQGAQREWWRLDGQDRARIMRRIADAIRDYAQALGTLDTLDAGRPIHDTITRDTERAARLFEFFAGTTDRLRGVSIPVQPGRSNSIEYEPIGIVGAITPWNYPLTNAAGKIAPALATGNAVILKPAEETPLSALMLAWVAHQAGLPAGLLNVLNGSGPTIGDAIVRHRDIGKITFTGSTSVGRGIGTLAGGALKSVTLELGGKTGFIVLADADLERAADALVFSAFNNAGQTCTAGSRLLVADSVADAFLRMVSARIGRIRAGDPLDPDTLVGPTISARHRDQIRARMKEAEAAGLVPLDAARVAVPEQGFFVPPTVYLDVDPAHALAREEIFGPIVTVSRFRDVDEAIAISNATPYGLATTVFTTNIQSARRISRRAQSGIVWVNTVHSLHPGSPYGGYKQSGVGLEMGEEAIRQHMHIKTIWSEDGDWQSPWGALVPA